MQTKAAKLAIAIVAISLVSMPLVLVQLLGSERGTTWRVLGLDLMGVLVSVAAWLLLRDVGKSVSAEPSAMGRILLSGFLFAFVAATGRTFYTRAVHDTVSQLIHTFGHTLFVNLPGCIAFAASLELWQSWRKAKKSQMTTNA